MAETAELPADVKEEIERVADITKKGFDLKARLEGRGLRRASITLYLDEVKGVELGWANDVTNQLGQVVGRAREGVIGELDSIMESQKAILETRRADANAIEVLRGEGANLEEHFNAPTGLEERIAELEAKRDGLIEELTKSAIVVQMRAVPPVIQKDCRRRAKATLAIETKSVPKEMEDDFNLAFTAHLMAVVVQSITDNETGITNTETTYDDAIALMDFLPPGQFQRFDNKLAEVQFTDAISLSIEGQEDFS